VIATDARSDALIWTTQIPVLDSNRPLAIRSSNNRVNSTVHVVSPLAIFTFDETGESIWRTPGIKVNSEAPPDYFGTIAVTDTSVIVTSRSSFSGFNRLTGKPSWNRSIVGQRTATIQETNSHRIVAITFNTFRTSGD
jgi:outer membrane protein assembly factor BamB